MRNNDEISKHYSISSNKYKYFDIPEGIHKKIISWTGEGKAVLDIGCANGYLGQELKKNRNILCGIEISETAAKEARKYYDNIIVGNIESMEMPYKSEQFDVIICADILEHLFNPEKILKRLNKYLKASGSIIVSIPNIAHWSIRLKLLLGRFEYEETGLLDCGHIRFFTYDSARKMFNRAGYNIEREDSVISLPKGFNKFAYIFKLNWLFKMVGRSFWGYQFIFFLKKDG